MIIKCPRFSCIKATVVIAIVCFLCGCIFEAYHLLQAAAGLGGTSTFDIRSERIPSAFDLQAEDINKIPSIIRSWRSAKLDWHSLIPTHNSLWERFGTPTGEGKLRALVAKEILITDYLTRYHESGLAGMFGHDHGPLTAYSGCNSFPSGCMVHDETQCNVNELCGWAKDNQLCVDIWDSRVTSSHSNRVLNTCPYPKIIGEKGFESPVSAAQCTVWVQQPAVMVTLEVVSQSMFYHWWGAWSGIVAHWKTTQHSRRDVHYFVHSIHDPMFFPFFGLLSDHCWRRKSAEDSPPCVCYCNTDELMAGQSREDAGGAAMQMMDLLGVQDTLQSPAKRVKIGLISRRRKRFILNEYALVERVKQMGYDCVLLPLESMTLYEQMQQLRSLDVLVGVHGSALDNAVFLRPGSVLVQLLPYKVEYRVTFRATALAAGVGYLEWQLQDPSQAVFHWDLLEEANVHALQQLSKEQYLERGQQVVSQRETVMFWINQDIIVPLPEWESLIRRAGAESPAVTQRGLH